MVNNIGFITVCGLNESHDKKEQESVQIDITQLQRLVNGDSQQVHSDFSLYLYANSPFRFMNIPNAFVFIQMAFSKIVIIPVC